MVSLTSIHWPLILISMFLLQLRSADVQGIDFASQKLRRLNEQFQQFRALTQTRLDLLALNQSRNSAWALESRVQALEDRYQQMSQSLEQLNQSTVEKMESLRELNKKLEKKCKRIDGRIALLERSLRENRRQIQKEKPDLGQDFSNLSQELQSQEERLAALQAQRDELLVGLKGLQESLKNQVLRVTRVEGQLSEVLHTNRGGNMRSSVKEGGHLGSNVTPRGYYEPQSGGQTHKEGRPGRIPGGYYRPRTEGLGQTSRPHVNPHQGKITNQPKHFKAPPPGPLPRSRQDEYTNPRPLPDSHQPQSQVQLQSRTRPYPIRQEPHQPRQSVPFYNRQTEASLPRRQDLNHSSQSRTSTHLESNRNRQDMSRTRTDSQDVLPHRPPAPHESRTIRWKGEEEDNGTSVIPNYLQLPVRHKIPEQTTPKKDATICNVDSMLFFPTASSANYVTISPTLPLLPELSLCLWIRVEGSYVGTLFSYATEDNDNQLVLYGRDPSSTSPSTPHTFFSSSPFSSYPHNSPSTPFLDFVIGDTVYRRLPVSSILDAQWHHLCILWSSIQGRFWHYSDARLTSSGSNFRKGWEIPGGGSVVLGQEQDSVGGEFDSAEGFAGQMAGFRVWSRVLSPSEVKGVAEGKGVPRGVVLGMEDIKEIHGGVQHVACECLEHCV